MSMMMSMQYHMMICLNYSNHAVRIAPTDGCQMDHDYWHQGSMSQRRKGAGPGVARCVFHCHWCHAIFRAHLITWLAYVRIPKMVPTMDTEQPIEMARNGHCIKNYRVVTNQGTRSLLQMMSTRGNQDTKQDGGGKRVVNTACTQVLPWAIIRPRTHP